MTDLTPRFYAAAAPIAAAATSLLIALFFLNAVIGSALNGTLAAADGTDNCTGIAAITVQCSEQRTGGQQ